MMAYVDSANGWLDNFVITMPNQRADRTLDTVGEPSSLYACTDACSNGTIQPGTCREWSTRHCRNYPNPKYILVPIYAVWPICFQSVTKRFNPFQRFGFQHKLVCHLFFGKIRTRYLINYSNARPSTYDPRNECCVLRKPCIHQARLFFPVEGVAFEL